VHEPQPSPYFGRGPFRDAASRPPTRDRAPPLATWRSLPAVGDGTGQCPPCRLVRLDWRRAPRRPPGCDHSGGSGGRSALCSACRAER
jgi:hypothetical protein